MAEEEKSPGSDMDNPHTKNGNFICGVVEGFYGRPWTTEQRKDLFQKMKKWGMDSYLYAPKDDYKHRAYWRELYTVEEAEHLTSLVAAARECNVTFYYALSPGIDITYSSSKEIACLKRKLEQVGQFGCTAFALLFDDIESEMSEADKEVFQSFAHAQVSVTNEVYQHVGQPKFLFCPTQYCEVRAIPNVSNSEYLNTIGAKLAPGIDVMWTGPKVISKSLTPESVEDITEVLRRPPVIWDNLHANDYDQKRLYLGPYSGRTTDLIPRLRGVLLNPNCEYGANFVAIHTLAQWSRCNLDDRREVNDSVSADIKLETEGEDGSVEDVPATLPVTTYHPRRALRNAIHDWLGEFKRTKAVWGPIQRPQIVAAAPVPVMPSVNTCMTVTATTTTASGGAITASVGAMLLPMPVVPAVLAAGGVQAGGPTSPTVMINANQLHVLAEASAEALPLQTGPVPVMNSLVAENKVVCNETTGVGITPEGERSVSLDLPAVAASTPAIASPSESTTAPVQEPMDCNPTPNSSPPRAKTTVEDVPMMEQNEVKNGLEVDTGVNSEAAATTPTSSSSSSGMLVESADGEEDGSREEGVVGEEEGGVDGREGSGRKEEEELTIEDLALLCDLFYLPFEHGAQGMQLLQEFNWLKVNAQLVIGYGGPTDVDSSKPEVQEWFERVSKFEEMSCTLNRLFTRLSGSANRELLYDLYPYVWDMRGVVSLMNSYLRWLALGSIPQMVSNYVQGTYTWFSKGWKEAFMSGDQEPWVFRGGLTADLQRLIPVDSGNDLFVYKAPELPSTKIYTIRPYLSGDLNSVQEVSRLTCHNPSQAHLLVDRLVQSLVRQSPELCMVVEEDAAGVIGYALAALDSKQHLKRLVETTVATQNGADVSSGGEQPLVDEGGTDYCWQGLPSEPPAEVHAHHPSMLHLAVLPSVDDQSVAKRLLTCVLASLRANGSFGCYVEAATGDKYALDMYGKLGFAELDGVRTKDVTFLGRTF